MSDLLTKKMTQEQITQAQKEGATCLDRNTNTFYRKCPGGIENGKFENGKLVWRSDWRQYPPESTVKL